MQRIADDTEVLVVGAGTAGFVAAVAAARNGARTLLVDRNGFLGGTPVAALMTILITFHSSDGTLVAKGIPGEVVQRIRLNGGALGHMEEQQGLLRTATPIDAEVAKLTLAEMAEEAGVRVLLDTLCTDALVFGSEVRGVEVANKSGRQLLLARRVVDCSGDADVAAWAGAPFEQRPKEDVQPISLLFRMGNVDVAELVSFMREHPEQFKLGVAPSKLEDARWVLNCLEFFRPWIEGIKSGRLAGGFAVEQAWFHTHAADMGRGEVTFNMTRLVNVDGTDARELSDARLALGRQVKVAESFLREHFPGCKNGYLIESAPMLGVRETRRIVGEYQLTKADVQNGVRFPDTVALAATPIDIHEAGGDARYIWLKTDRRGSIPYGIPYRCLLPQKVENLLVAGRSISATYEASGSTRMQVACMAVGEAAGTAAALSLREGVYPRHLDVRLLREQLQAQGAEV